MIREEFMGGIVYTQSIVDAIYDECEATPEFITSYMHSKSKLPSTREVEL